VVLGAQGQIALQVADPEGVDLPALAPLHDGDSTWRASVQSDQFLERAVELGVPTFGTPKGSCVGGGHG
jgi:hypothetical protein